MATLWLPLRWPNVSFPVCLRPHEVERPARTSSSPSLSARDRMKSNARSDTQARACSPSLSQLLADRSEKDFIDVDVVGLAHREQHHASEGVSRERDLHGFADALG